MRRYRVDFNDRESNNVVEIRMSFEGNEDIGIPDMGEKVIVYDDEMSMHAVVGKGYHYKMVATFDRSTIVDFD